MTTSAPPAATLTPERLRAWAWHKQGLDGSLQGKTSGEVLDHAGWARSVGGANPYLTLFARAGISREQADRDVKALRIHELPTARGCTYVLGQSDYPWALQIGRDAAIAPFKVLARLGVDRAEITLLEDQVEHVLQESSEPMDPKQLRDVLGDSVRSLGRKARRRGPPPHCQLPSGCCRRMAVSAACPSTAASINNATPTPVGAFSPAGWTTTAPAAC